MIARNDVHATNTSLDLDAVFNGFVQQNVFRDGIVGVRYDFAAGLSDNDIYGNQVGIISTVDSSTEGLGFQVGVLPNRIHDNLTGVQLTGRMQYQSITRNTTGVLGSVS